MAGNASKYRAEKRARLIDLVSRMGQAALPAEIREAAYREGIGQVNAAMLVSVRNELWPDRVKRRGGRPAGIMTADTVADLNDSGIALCPGCGSHKTTVQQVSRPEEGSIRRTRLCKCGHLFTTINERPPKQLHKRRIMARLLAEKECTVCKRVLPVSCFGKKSADSDLYRSHCRECSNQKRMAHYAKECVKEYGISPKDYEAMLAQQGGVCAICREPGNLNRLRFRPLNIDHCHATGLVRGLLCDKCNLGIGNFNDDVARLESAVLYLRRQRADAI